MGSGGTASGCGLSPTSLPRSWLHGPSQSLRSGVARSGEAEGDAQGRGSEPAHVLLH